MHLRYALLRVGWREHELGRKGRWHEVNNLCVCTETLGTGTLLVETKMAYKCYRVVINVIGRISCTGPWRLRDNAISTLPGTPVVHVNGPGLGSVNDSLNGEECREEIH